MRINCALITRTFAAIAVIGSAVLLGLPANATAEGTGQITGTVQNDGPAPAGLGGICVNATEGHPYGSHVGSADTGPTGTYTLTGLPAGDIYLYFRDCNSPAIYVTEWFGDTYNSDKATPIKLGSGALVEGKDVALKQGVVVSGRVTVPSDNPIGDPIKGVDVSVDSTEEDGAHGRVQTDANGEYTTPVLPGDYRVQFRSDDDIYAIQYWNKQPTRDSAQTLTISGPASVPNIDAELTLGASISGTVKRPDGTPAPNICVSTDYFSDDDWDNVGWDQKTDTSGKYKLSQLPAGSHRVEFEDCDDTGPYLDQWYDGNNGSNSRDGAKTIVLAAGQTLPGVNAALRPAALIQGTVTDTSGKSLENICVQATTDAFVGGADDTGTDGNYSIKVALAGDYKIQFVDCGDPEDGISSGGHLAKWWGGGIEPSSAKSIPLTLGERKTVKVSLDMASDSGAVTGRATNLRKEGLSACVVLYLPDEFAVFTPTDVNGNYSFDNVPTGTFYVGFLGLSSIQACEEGEPTTQIPDAGKSGAVFEPMWFGGASLAFNGDAPDPVAQHGTTITVHPGETINASVEFGHGSIKIKPPVIGDDFILVDFDTTGLATGDGKNAITQASLTYRVGCDSTTGTLTSASQDYFPVKVSGFTPGAPYACKAHVLSNGVEVADSASFEVKVGTATPTEPTEPTDDDPATTPAPPGEAPGSNADPVAHNPSGPSPAKLAYTGRNIAVELTLGAFMILLGFGMVMTTKRVGSGHPRRRATS